MVESAATPGLEELRCFLAVVRSGSFSGAAKGLALPKATVSRRVAELERRLATLLLERTTRSVRLTDAGRDYAEHAAAALAALDDATARIHPKAGPVTPRGRLRVTAPIEYGVCVLSPLLADFVAAEPRIELDLDLTGRQVDLVHEGFDLALRVGSVPDSTLTATRLGRIAYGLYASPAYLAAQGAPGYVHELAERPALQFTGSDAAPLWQLTDGRQEMRVPIAPRLRSNSHWVLRDAALAGLGVAFCAELVAEPEVAAGRLTRLFPEFGAPEIPVHAVFPSQRFLAPKVRACLDFLAARLGEPS
jgi:LysR family transcriptional regulator for bpeEF and oprC